MKILLLATLLCASALGQGSDSTPPPAQVRAELLVVRLPEDRALELQPELRDPTRAAAGQEKLLAMIKRKEARLVDWPVVTTLSDNRAVVENVHEVRFAIEYEQPEIGPKPPVDPTPQAVPTPTAPPLPPAAPATPQPTVTQPATIQPANAQAAPPSAEAPLSWFGGTPTTFESRNVGVIFEVTPNINPDGKTLTAQLSPQHVSLLGFRDETLQVINHFAVVTKTPEFDTQKISTTLTFASGTPQLVGFFRLQQPADTVELMLVTLTIIPTK